MDELNIKEKIDVVELFETARRNKTFVKISAPMVRYSRLQFRSLIRKYGTDMCFTPMIMADSFCQSSKARANEFITTKDDTPVIAQFAAKKSYEFLSAAEMIYPYAEGIDLNCGCPQRWAIADGYGSALLNSPDIIKDLISTVRRNLPNNFSVSVKIRLLSESLNKTIELCRQLEMCGATFISVHGRTASQRTSEPVNLEYIAEIKKSITIPVIANGDIKSLYDANSTYEATKCDGVMTARGILTNPALYAGYEKTPIACIQDWLDINSSPNNLITFQCFHHHLTFMTEKLLNKRLRISLNSLTDKQQVYEFIDEHFSIQPQIDNLKLFNMDIINCIYDESEYRLRRDDDSNNY